MKKARSLSFRNVLVFCGVSLGGGPVPLYGDSSALISLNPVLGSNPKTSKRPLPRPSKEVKKNTLKEINQNNLILTPEVSDSGQVDIYDFSSMFFDSCKNFSLESSPVPESMGLVPGQVAEARLETEREEAARLAAQLQAERERREEVAWLAVQLQAERARQEEAARLEEERARREEEARLEEERARREEAARLEEERARQEEAARLETEREEAARLEEERERREEAARLEEERERREAEEQARREEEARLETEREEAALLAAQLQAEREREEQARQEEAFEGVRFLFESKEERSDAVTQEANEAIQEVLKALRVSQESEEQRARRQVAAAATAPAELLAAADKGGQVVVTTVPAQSSYLKSVNFLPTVNFLTKTPQVLNNFFSWFREGNLTSADAARLEEQRARQKAEEREPQAREREEAEPALETVLKALGIHQEKVEETVRQAVELQLAEERERPQVEPKPGGTGEAPAEEEELLDAATQEKNEEIALNLGSTLVEPAADVDAAAPLASISPASPVAEERFTIPASDSRAQDCSSPLSVADLG